MNITWWHSFRPPQAVAAVAVAGAGDYVRAERIARSILDMNEQAKALATVATAVAGAGDYDHAEQIA